MFLFTLIFLPPLIAMGMSMQHHFKERKWFSMVAFPFIVLTTILYFYLATLEVEGMPTDPRMVKACNYVMLLVLPVLFLLFCHKGEGRYSPCIEVLLALLLLNLTGGMELQLGSVRTEPMKVEGMFRVVCDGQLLFSYSMFQFIMMAQLACVAGWVWDYLHAMEVKGQCLSKQGMRIVLGVIVSLAASFLALAMPTKWWFGNIAVPYISFAVISASFTAVELMTSWGWKIVPISKTEEESVAVFTREKRKLGEEIRALVEGERLYLNADLRITDIAERLGTNRTYVSRAINDMVGINFTAYVNSCRVKEAQKMLEDNPNINLHRLAIMCGFTSFASLARSYKRITGKELDINSKLNR